MSLFMVSFHYIIPDSSIQFKSNLLGKIHYSNRLLQISQTYCILKTTLKKVTVPGPNTGIRKFTTNYLSTHVYQLKACLSQIHAFQPSHFPTSINTHKNTHTYTNVNSTENTFHSNGLKSQTPVHKYQHYILNLKHFLVPLQVGVYEHFLRPYNEIFICKYTNGMALLQMSSLDCTD